MSLDQLHPFAGQHAVQSAAFAVDFSTELDVGEVGLLRAAAAGLRADFPEIADNHLTTLRFQVGSGQQDLPVSPAAKYDVGGFVIQRPADGVDPVAPVRQIVVSRKNVVIVINNYTRWAKFKTDIERYLNVLLNPVNAQKGVSSVGIQFSDAFVWRADPDELNLAEVFSTNTQYLVPSVFKKGATLWHSHHGYLVEQADPVVYQQLDNINVSRNLVAGAQQLQILTSHKATFAKPLYKILNSNKDKVSKIMDFLHSTNKGILADLLTDEVQTKISLNTQKD
ncbi:MAG: TIGR04255 family protein [Halothiobacillaceae bacterium]|nr:TIGR04255 family protein [Halothiobacillaceae bacterium]